MTQESRLTPLSTMIPTYNPQLGLILNQTKAPSVLNRRTLQSKVQRELSQLKTELMDRRLNTTELGQVALRPTLRSGPVQSTIPSHPKDIWEDHTALRAKHSQVRAIPSTLTQLPISQLRIPSESSNLPQYKLHLRARV